MKRYAVWIVLLLATPALATISQRQSPVSQWNAGASSTCFATLGSTPIATDLFVVWSFWTYTPPNQLTAKVTDSFGNTFVSAVGPTLQTASNTFAQIFYVPNLSSGTGSDKLTVTYYLNGTITNANTSGCVFVEYQGADLNYPLDSVSAGYSSSLNPTSLLDSGTVAPANSNLLVFAGGISDGGAANAGTGFTSIQSRSFTGGGSAITEQNSSAITGNNTLQRATACLSALTPCPTTPTGNWLMQMAVFRDASSTVAGGWPPARLGQVLYASQFPGSDASAKIQNAIAALPPSGGTVSAIDLQDPGGTGSTTIDPGSKLVTLLLGPYTYYVTQVLLRSGFTIIGIWGAQSRGSTLESVSSTNQDVVALGGTASVQGVDLENINIGCAVGNTSQVGAHIIAQAVGTGGGLWYSRMIGVNILGCFGGGLILDANPVCNQSCLTGVNQFDTFINLVANRPFGGLPGLRITGFNGQMNFINSEFDGQMGTRDCIHGPSDCGYTNIEIDEGSSTVLPPYSIVFNNVTSQYTGGTCGSSFCGPQASGSEGVAIYLAGSMDFVCYGCHFEADGGAVRMHFNTTPPSRMQASKSKAVSSEPAPESTATMATSLTSTAPRQAT